MYLVVIKSIDKVNKSQSYGNMGAYEHGCGHSRGWQKDNNSLWQKGKDQREPSL